MATAPRPMWMNRLELLALAAGIGLRAARFLDTSALLRHGLRDYGTGRATGSRTPQRAASAR